MPAPRVKRGRGDRRSCSQRVELGRLRGGDEDDDLESAVGRRDQEKPENETTSLAVAALCFCLVFGLLIAVSSTQHAEAVSARASEAGEAALLPDQAVLRAAAVCQWSSRPYNRLP